jgi:hypothetical protein
MIFKPDKKVMLAFRNLRGNPNFMTILEFLGDCRDRTDHEGHKTVEEYKLRWNQGGGQVIDEILFLYDESKKIV